MITALLAGLVLIGGMNENEQSIFTDTTSKPTIAVSKLASVEPAELLELPEGADIVSFVFTIDLPTGEIATVKNYGNSFNSKIRELMRTTAAGALFTLDNVFVNAGDERRKYPSRFYYIIAE